ncbi:HAD-IA family hydrolase [Solirubrobacter taibaiensis]|nr:HAD-IA family hydrolase [Solirubrobacter taibaiensis]
MPAMFFGSISTIADTSELQRQAYNDAFAQHGLDWSWDQDEYRSLLTSSGGSDRLAEYARAKNESVDADAVHQTKSELFQSRLADAGLTLRPGVAEVLHEARDNGFQIAFVTTTALENVTALLGGLHDLDESDFDLIVSRSDVETPKPDGAAYDFALLTLGVTADQCVAIEDNVGGVQAATAMGVRCIAFPNENTAEHDFAQAERRVERLEFSDVQSTFAAA